MIVFFFCQFNFEQIILIFDDFFKKKKQLRTVNLGAYKEGGLNNNCVILFFIFLKWNINILNMKFVSRFSLSHVPSNLKKKLHWKEEGVEDDDILF